MDKLARVNAEAGAATAIAEATIEGLEAANQAEMPTQFLAGSGGEADDRRPTRVDILERARLMSREALWYATEGKNKRIFHSNISHIRHLRVRSFEWSILYLRLPCRLQTTNPGSCGLGGLRSGWNQGAK